MPTVPYKIVPDPNLIDPRLLEIVRDNPKYWSGKPIRWPGASTLAGMGKDSTPLLIWANRLGLEGIEYRDALEEAADAGTLAHLMVECDIRNLPEPNLAAYPNEVVQKASNSFIAYLDWKAQTKIKPVKTELSLLSNRWLFGGTLDAVQMDGKLTILDWKTSGGLYESMLVQVGGGYSLLWKENYPNDPITGGYQIVRFSKIEADFDHYHRQNLEVCERAFIEMRLLYELMKQVKERL